MAKAPDGLAARSSISIVARVPDGSRKLDRRRVAPSPPSPKPTLAEAPAAHHLLPTPAIARPDPGCRSRRSLQTHLLRRNRPSRSSRSSPPSHPSVRRGLLHSGPNIPRRCIAGRRAHRRRCKFQASPGVHSDSSKSAGRAHAACTEARQNQDSREDSTATCLAHHPRGFPQDARGINSVGLRSLGSASPGRIVRRPFWWWYGVSSASSRPEWRATLAATCDK